MAQGPEVQPSAEHGVEVGKAAAEQLEVLKQKSPEASVENAADSEAKAKQEALKQAVSVEAGSAEREHKQPATSSAKRHGVVSKKDKEASFKKQIKRVQNELPPAERAFSKVLHNKTVEKTSDVVGSTIARPDAILSGAVAAFLLVLAVYIIAKIFGYVLSGFEAIAAFIIGWVLGVVYDYVKTLVTGRSS